MLWLHNNDFTGDVPLEWSELESLDHLNLLQNSRMRTHERQAARELFGEGVIFI